MRKKKRERLNDIGAGDRYRAHIVRYVKELFPAAPISKKKDSFEPHSSYYDEADRIPDNIEYIVHKNKSAVSRKGVIAILPAFNEEISIGSMVLHAREHAERVIVVDDGSSDRTAEIARFAGAEVIRHPKNMGKGAALKTGFDLAGERCKGHCNNGY